VKFRCKTDAAFQKVIKIFGFGNEVS
jgi:hypothetical protein